MENFILKRRNIFLLSFIICIYLSIVALKNLSIRMYPVIVKPVVYLMITHRGYPANEFIKNYSKQMYDGLKTIEDIDFVSASHSNSSSTYIIEFGWSSNSSESKSLVDTKMNNLKSMFPSDFTYDIYFNDNSGGFFISTIESKNPDMSANDIYKLTNDYIIPKISTIKDVANVSVGNIERFNIKVDIIFDKLIENNLTISEIQQALSNFDNIPIGSFRTAKDSYQVTILKELDFKDDIYKIGDIEISYKNNRVVLLKDIANINIDYRLPRNIIKSNGKQSIAITASPTPDGNIRSMAQEMKSIIEELKLSNEKLKDLDLIYVIDPSAFINSAVNGIIKSALTGGILAFIIVFIILGDIRNTLIIGISIPLSIIYSFLLMDYFKVSINLISLSGITLSIGMVIDASIVIIENLYRIKQEERPKTKTQLISVIIKGTAQVRNSIIVSTLTSILVFFPINFTAPIANAILGDQAKTVIFALTFSVIISLILVPIIFYYIYSFDLKKIKKNKKNFFLKISNTILDFFLKIYHNTLQFILKSYFSMFFIILLSFLLLVFSVIFLAPKLKQEIIADPKGTVLQILARNLKTEESLELFNRITEVENKVMALLNGSYNNLLTQIYSSNVAYLLVTLKDNIDIEKIKNIIQDNLINDEEWNFSTYNWDPSKMPIPQIFDYRIEINGDDSRKKIELLREISLIVNELNKKDRFIDRNVTEPNISKRADEIILTERKEITNNLKGLNMNYIQSLLKTALKGNISQITFLKEGENIDVNIGFDLSINTEIELENMLIPFDNKLIPLKHFYNFNKIPSTNTLKTEEGEEKFYIDFIFNKEKNKKDLKNTLINKISKIKLEDGYSIEYINRDQDMQDTINSLLKAFLIAISLIYLLLAFQFSSLLIPLIILITIPLGVTGVIISLYIFKSTISLNSLLGTILLGGIVVNNAIIMIDFYHQIKKDYTDRKEAILDTVKLRFIPIIITMLTTVLGMLPIVLSLGQGGNIIQPLGIAVAGGLLFSTFFTLYLIPIFLYLIKD